MKATEKPSAALWRGLIVRVAPCLAAAFLVRAATAGVIDDAKFKLDLRGGDPNGNAFVDSGEVVNAYNSAQTAVLGGGQGPSTITAAQYASGGYNSYGVLPFVAVTNAVNPANGSTYRQKCLVLPQSKKTVGSDAYWSENGIIFAQGAVNPGSEGYVTLYVRFKWDGNTSGPNYLFGNGWDGAYGSADNGISIYITGGGGIGLVGGGGMPESTLKISSNVWYDLFVKVRNENVNGTELAVAEIVLNKANANAAPTKTTVSHNHNKPMQYSASKTRITFGCYLTANGWAQKTNPRAFRGLIADAMIWDRALTAAEMAEVMVGSGALGGEWQIGARNGNADEFGDNDPANVFDVQTMPWSRMRKTLDASNSALALAMTMTSSEHQMARALSIAPILSGTGATVPVEVALNGTPVGEIDLASETSITLPKELWRHDGTANTITVTRTGTTSGTVQFDAISLAPAPTATSVLDDAFFKLDLRGGASTFTQPGDLGNAFDFSAASPLAGYMGDQRGPQTYNANFGNLPAQETADVQNPYYPYTTNTQTVLHFYQDFKGEDKGSVNSGIVIPGVAPHGLVQTYYIRFRWDGVAPAKTGEANAPAYIFMSGQSSNGNDQNNGVALNLDSITVNGTTTNAILACRVGASGTARYPQMTGTTLSAGKWIDAFVTFAANADNTGFTTTFSACTPSPTDNNFNPPQLRSQSVSSIGGLSFDSTNLSLGLYHDSANTRATTRCFRGLIADFMIWDRALTDEEKIEVMAGQHGAKWRVGAINGSADEFTDTDPAAVFEPQSMPWRQMRKTLDASHPSLTLKSPLATYEAGKPMILHVDPIFTGTGASVPVSVAVNGTAIGSFDLAQKRNFIIEKRSWQRDGSGNVTVTLTRTETTGSVAIDAITLSGSWQIQGNGMLDQKYAANRYFAGDPVASHAGSSISVAANHKVYNFGVWVPAGMGELCGWKFHSKATSMHSDVLPANRTFTLSVNGAIKATVNGVARGETYSIALPEGTLRDGMNMVEFRQTVPASGTEWSFYDHWGMTLVPPANPFVLTFR